MTTPTADESWKYEITSGDEAVLIGEGECYPTATKAFLAALGDWAQAKYYDGDDEDYSRVRIIVTNAQDNPG